MTSLFLKESDSVLILGNGDVYDPTATADIIVRLNHGVVEECDVWIDNISQLPSYDSNHPTPKQHIQLRDWISKKEHQQITRELGIPRPTTGMQILWKFKKEFPTNTKYITGFKGRRNRYTNRIMSVPHNWRREREIVWEWLREGIYESRYI